MKRSCATVAIVALVLIGCHARARPPHPMRWARMWITALNSGQLPYFDPLFPTATYEDATTSRPLSGLDLAYLLGWRMSHFPAMHYEIERVTSDDDIIALEWRATPVAAPNTLPQRGVFLIRLRGAAIASVRAY